MILLDETIVYTSQQSPSMEQNLSENPESNKELHLPAFSKLLELSEKLLNIIDITSKDSPDGRTGEVKAAVVSLLPSKEGQWLCNESSKSGCLTNLFLCCSALASVDEEAAPTMSWVSKDLCSVAVDTIAEISEFIYFDPDHMPLKVNSEYRLSYENKGLDLTNLPLYKRLILDMIPQLFPALKDTLKNSCGNYKDESMDSIVPTVPLNAAIIASHQMRWCLKKIEHPFLGPVAMLALPCTLTALDHWSPDVKGQSLATFMHLGNNLNSAELLPFKDVILDAVSRNIAGSERIWQQLVETAVLLSVRLEGNEPRSCWYRQILNEMIEEMERHPDDKERRLVWLQNIDPLLRAMGLLILAHFRRLFPLFFHWLQAKDDATLKLTIERIYTVTKFTWMHYSPFLERLVENLVRVHKQSRGRKSYSDISASIIQVLSLLQLCHGQKFIDIWRKYRDDSILF